LTGDFEKTEEMAEEALHLGTPVDVEVAVTAFGAHLSYLRWLQGRVEELDPAAMEVWADQYPNIPGWRAAVAFVHSEAGRHDEARPHYDRLASDDFGTLLVDGQWLLSLCLLAQVAVLMHDVRGVEVLYDLLLPYADQYATVTPGIASLGSVSTVLGPLAAALDRWPAATEHFETAAKLNAGANARPFEVLTLRYYAQALIEKGGQADLAKAASLVDKATEYGRALGMARVVAACEELRPDAERTRRGEPSWSFGRIRLR
jgi:hypothetical protein